MSFAAASAVDPRGDGAYGARIAAGWDVAGNAQGGYLMALTARAAADACGRPDPVAVTAHYLRPGRPGPVGVVTEVLRSGRRLSTVRATLSSDDRPILAILGTFAELGEATDTLERVEARPPELPPPEDCVRLQPTETFPPPFVGRVDLRLDPEDARFGRGTPRFQGWLRFPDGEIVDTLGLLVAVDAFPPTAFNADLPIAWTPTIELTAHIRARPAPGWLRCVFSTRFITGGFLEEDGEVWDSTGRLVAQSRQLALLPRG